MARLLLVNWLVLAIAVAVTAAVMPGIEIDDGVGTVLGIAAVFGLVNVLLGTIVRFLALPLMVITLGLISLVINGFMFLVTDWILDDLDIDGFLPAIVGACLISLIVVLLNVVFRPLLARSA